jgi:hypothetical protein
VILPSDRDSNLWDVWQVFYAPYSECGPGCGTKKDRVRVARRLSFAKAQETCEVNQYDSTLGYGYSMHPHSEPDA